MKTQITKDLTNKKIQVLRAFNAPKNTVWTAWTTPALLDKWWAPKPWKAATKSMNFCEGGHWHYSMNGPDGTQVWSWIDYLTIAPQDSFTAHDSFCDEQGIKTSEFPSIHWEVNFHDNVAGTQVAIEMSFASEADIKTIVEMGFEAGFSAALENLDELLSMSA